MFRAALVLHRAYCCLLTYCPFYRTRPCYNSIVQTVKMHALQLWQVLTLCSVLFLCFRWDPALQTGPMPAQEAQQSAGVQQVQLQSVPAPQQQPAEYTQQHEQQTQQNMGAARLADVAGWSCQMTDSSGSMQSPSATPRAVRLARLTLPDGLGGSRVMSPLARLTSPGGLGPNSTSQSFSPGPAGALQRRSSSSLSHRWAADSSCKQQHSLLGHICTAGPARDAMHGKSMYGW